MFVQWVSWVSWRVPNQVVYVASSIRRPDTGRPVALKPGLYGLSPWFFAFASGIGSRLVGAAVLAGHGSHAGVRSSGGRSLGSSR
jgi:hypothetical protein